MNLSIHHELCAMSVSHTGTCVNSTGGNLPYTTNIMPQSVLQLPKVSVTQVTASDVTRLMAELIISKQEARTLLGFTNETIP